MALFSTFSLSISNPKAGIIDGVTLYFYRISICLYFLTSDFQPYNQQYHARRITPTLWPKSQRVTALTYGCFESKNTIEDSQKQTFDSPFYAETTTSSSGQGNTATSVHVEAVANRLKPVSDLAG